MPGKMKNSKNGTKNGKHLGKPPKKKKGRKLRKGRISSAGSKSKTKTVK